jgi:hypothetical protein
MLTKQDCLDLITEEPYIIGKSLGFTDLTELHNEWIRSIMGIESSSDYTLQAHRGSYKTTCLTIAIALMLLLNPDKNIIFLRKTDSDVKEVLRQVYKIMSSTLYRYMVKVIWDIDLAFTELTAFNLSTNLSVNNKGTSQLQGLGLKASITGKHSDTVITDDICFVAGTKVATPFGNKNIEDLKVGDYVITPCGYNRIINTTNREAEVITSCGLTGTKNHPIYNKDTYQFESLNDINYNNISKINIKEIIKWKIAKTLYNGTEKNGKEQEENILSYAQILKTGLGKCCTEQYGQNIMGKFLKTVLFIIKTIIQIITTLITLSVFHVANIKECTLWSVLHGLKKIWKKVHALHCLNGKKLKQVKKGSKKLELNFKKETWKNLFKKLNAKIAGKNTQPTSEELLDYAENAGEKKQIEDVIKEKKKEKVYNIEVGNANVYYANNILVHNCNLKDRISKAERDLTKLAYMELQNIRNRGGRIVNTGTPWHKLDCFTIMPKAEVYDCYQTGLIDRTKLSEIRQSMTPSLFAANYELKHIANEESLFDNPIFTKDNDLILNGIAHIDASYGGSDGTAFTVLKQHGEQLVIYGMRWNKHVNDCLNIIFNYLRMYKVGTVYVETNADKGYLAKELRGRGAIVGEYHESTNKFVKISTYLRKNWKNITFLECTDPEYMNEILDYTENAEHDDSPDGLASLIRISTKPKWLY